MALEMETRGIVESSVKNFFLSLFSDGKSEKSLEKQFLLFAVFTSRHDVGARGRERRDGGL